MDNVRVLIAFYSRTGSVEALANAMAEGALEEGAEVRLRRVREVVSEEIMGKAEGWLEGARAMNERYEAPSHEDIEWADAIALGSPTRFGVVTSELKAFVDSLGGLWAQGKLVNKVGSAFTSTSTPHGGNELTMISLLTPMMHFGMLVVTPGYTDPILFGAGSPYGATAVVGQGSSGPSENDLAVARHQGRRMAQVAKMLKAGQLQTAGVA